MIYVPCDFSTLSAPSCVISSLQSCVISSLQSCASSSRRSSGCLRHFGVFSLSPRPLWSVCLHQRALLGSQSTWSHVTRGRWCVTLSESQHSEPSSERCPRGSRTACAAHSPIRALWVVPTLSRSVQGAVNSRTHGFV